MNRDTVTPNVTSLTGDISAAWIDYYHDHAAPGEHEHTFVWNFTADAAGPFCTDADGNVFLDFTCHIGAAPLGYNNPKIMEPMAAFDLVDPMKVAGQDFYLRGGGTPTEPDVPGPAQLMDRLTDLTAHYDLDTVFLSNSGAEAIENAMKITEDDTENPKHGVTFHGSFHGRTHGTLSLTRAGDVYTRKYAELPGVRDVPFCTDRHCAADSCRCGFFAEEESKLRQMVDPDRGWIDPSEVAYVMLEPVQGVGGYNFPSEAFMAEVGAVCEEYDIHLIVDEIQSGLGRTGELWAADHYPIEPDVIASAKALRVGATISRSDVFPETKNRIGSTWGGGDILGSIQGTLTIDAIDAHDLLENAVDKGRALRERLRDDMPATAVDVRGKGLMLAVTFDSPNLRDAVVRGAMERGLLVLGCGHESIRILPPLDVTSREIEMGADLLVSAAEAAP